MHNGKTSGSKYSEVDDTLKLRVKKELIQHQGWENWLKNWEKLDSD